MTLEVDFLPFATDNDANVESQDDYAADPTRGTGNQAGLARSPIANKAWRQSSMMAAALANRISQAANVDVLDDGDLDSLIAKVALVCPRYALSGDLTLYVSGTGSNANNGLTAGTPFLTRQFAYEWAQNHLDLQGHVLTFQQANGTTTDTLAALGPIVGQRGADSVVFLGDGNTPGNVIVNSAIAIFAGDGGAKFTVKGFQLASSAGNCIVANATGTLIKFDRINFGASLTHLGAGDGGQVRAVNAAAYSILGGASTHLQAQFGGLINTNNATVTIANAPAFADEFADAIYGAIIEAGAVTYTNAGTVTGRKYQSAANAVIYTGTSGSAGYFPGDIPGVTSSGGQYV